MSRSRPCSVLRAETGEALGAHIRRMRTERAKELLADGSLAVGAVARRLGYPSGSAFSHAFRQACGATPTAWRGAHAR